MPENSLLIHPDDARPLHVKDGERVSMASRTGAAEVPVSFTKDVLRGTVFLSHGWGLYSRDPKDTSEKLRGTAAALFLPDDEGDEFTGLPLYSGIPCKVEKIKAKKPKPKKKMVKKTVKKKAVKKAVKKEQVAKPKKKVVKKAAKKKVVAKPKKKAVASTKKRLVKKTVKEKGTRKTKAKRKIA